MVPLYTFVGICSQLPPLKPLFPHLQKVTATASSGGPLKCSDLGSQENCHNRGKGWSQAVPSYAKLPCTLPLDRSKEPRLQDLSIWIDLNLLLNPAANPGSEGNLEMRGDQGVFVGGKGLYTHNHLIIYDDSIPSALSQYIWLHPPVTNSLPMMASSIFLAGTCTNHPKNRTHLLHKCWHWKQLFPDSHP